MDDITPSLLEAIRNDFEKRIGTSTTIRALSKKIKNNTATYSDAKRYASEVGNIRAKVLKNQINDDKLPNGKMYYNIANEVINDSLKSDYKRIQPICNVAQSNKNKSMKLGIKAVETEIDQDNIDNIVNMVSASETYDQHSKIFEMACVNFASNVVDRNMRKNAEFHKTIGLKVTVVRVGGSECCEYCSGLTGTYKIDNAPSEIWGRHNDCSCSIDYESR